MATVAQQIAALGLDSSYGGRSNLYKQSGLGGNFTGTAAQNLALLAKVNSGWRPGAAAPTGAPAGAPPAPVDTRSELQKVAEQQAKDRTALVEGQNAKQQGFFDEYKTKIAGQEKSGAAYDRLTNEAGVPQLREQMGIFKGQIYKIKDMIDRLGEDINSRVSGSFTTEAQARRIEAAEGGELNTQLGRLGTGMAPVVDALSGATQDVSNRLGFMQQDQARELKPLELEISSLSDRFAREITGFDKNKQGELDTLVEKIQRQQELDDREWQRVQQLASEERSFSREKQKAAQSLAEREASLRSAGIDPATGRPFATPAPTQTTLGQPQGKVYLGTAPGKANSFSGATPWSAPFGNTFSQFSGGLVF